MRAIRCAFTRLGRLQFSRHELRAVGFDHVALLEIGELRDLDAALEVLGHFADVVLEAAERFEFAVPDDGRVADDADLRIADELAGLHVATRDRADLRDLEDLAYFGAPEDDLAELRSEHPDHRFFQVVFYVIDDLIEAQIDLFGIRLPFDRLVGTDVEADQHRVRSRGQVDVVRRDPADAGENDADVDFG